VFTQYLQANAGIVTTNRPWPPSSNFLPTQHSLSSSHFILCHITSAIEISSLNRQINSCEKCLNICEKFHINTHRAVCDSTEVKTTQFCIIVRLL